MDGSHDTWSTMAAHETRSVPHGSPEDRGSADAYYWRPYRPHKWLDGLGRDEVILTDPAEIAAYDLGFFNETDRKDWR
jgi:hypothetical protein